MRKQRIVLGGSVVLVSALTLSLRGTSPRGSEQGHVEEPTPVEVVPEVAPPEAPEEGPAVPAFLSSADLDEQHPFRRLATYGELREDYEAEVKSYSERIQELKEQSERAKQEAREAREELQARCEAQVAAWFEGKEAVWLQLVDERLAAERLQPLRELSLDLGVLLPAEQRSTIEEGLGEIQALLADGLEEQLVIEREAGESEVVDRGRERIARVGDELERLFGARVARPWNAALEGADRQRERLGPEHDARMERAAKLLESIRSELHERITCAASRTREELAKRLRARLKQMEMPAPGEVEGALEDVSAQIDQMIALAVGRTEVALTAYEEELLPCNASLRLRAGGELDACSASLARLRAELARRTSEQLERTWRADDSWQSRAELDEARHALRSSLRAAVNRGRDDVRSSSECLALELREHEVVGDDAWQDLKSALEEIAQEVANNCWKLDGPHLDGRFPAPNEEPEPEAGVVRNAGSPEGVAGRS